ncbi:hypothetical protein MTR_7g111940 [Medicago truncatula]|uniref:AP2/ERF domain-containing protein n=1 Tax=Medicago truncatula TaxID=3880 RepID=A0A072U449_MEDTR|nr:hypothetical protein MTR_7g111940 [Medicago truncatula]
MVSVSCTPKPLAVVRLPIRKIRQRRMKIAELEQVSSRPDVVEVSQHPNLIVIIGKRLWASLSCLSFIIFVWEYGVFESTATFYVAARYGSATPVPPSVIRNAELDIKVYDVNFCLIFVGGFDTVHAAARAYDQAAIKFRGVGADINFNLNDYDDDLKQIIFKVIWLIWMSISLNCSIQLFPGKSSDNVISA